MVHVVRAKSVFAMLDEGLLKKEGTLALSNDVLTFLSWAPEEEEEAESTLADSYIHPCPLTSHSRQRVSRKGSQSLISPLNKQPALSTVPILQGEARKGYGNVGA